MQPTAPRILLYNGTLVDGSGAPPRPGVSVLVEGNRIAAVDRPRRRATATPTGRSPSSTPAARRSSRASSTRTAT